MHAVVAVGACLGVGGEVHLAGGSGLTRCVPLSAILTIRPHLPPCHMQIKECTLPGEGQSRDPTSRHLGTLSWLALTLLVEEPDSPQLQRQVSNMCGKRWSRGDAANAEALEAGLRAAGHNPLLTAADQEQLALLLLSYAAHYTAVAQLPPQLAATLRLSAQDATRCLMQKEPGGALLTNLHAFMLTLDPRQRPQATAA